MSLTREDVNKVRSTLAERRRRQKRAATGFAVAASLEFAAVMVSVSPWLRFLWCAFLVLFVVLATRAALSAKDSGYIDQVLTEMTEETEE